MQKRDYVLAMFEDFGRALARVLRLGETRQFAEAWVEVGHTAEEFLGITTQQLETMLAADLIALARTGNGEEDTARWLLLVELLQVSGDLYQQEGREAAAVVFYLKALDVATQVSQRRERLPYFITRFDGLMLRLDGYVLPAGIGLSLMRGYEQAEQFAQAEDVLFHLLEDHPGDESILEAGLSLYDRLLQLSDFKLQSGGLPRDEVEESLAELLDLKG